ncbi:MAG: hypothetical protein A2583_09800 [Bdellovibrionales bacterium RIFOXYD1_FULL_53_11]|nr:MAG: hypothetical protein A2583_09800 [Bdellovibrionales bacterium RIFOXYD1_FULL_53_11]
MKRFHIILDILAGSLLAVWLAGGIPWNGKLLLRHGADPRRAAVILCLIAWFALPALRDKSIFLKGARAIMKWLEKPSARWGLFAFAFFWSCALGILQTLSLRYPLFDVGLFHQILWGISHGHGFTSNISGAGNFLLDHSSVSLVLLAPVYSLTNSSPLTIAPLHSALLFGGIAAWIYLAARAPGLDHPARNSLAAAVTVFALSFDSLWSNMRWGFHENAIAFTALSWAFALTFSDKRSPWHLCAAVLLSLVAAGSKELLLVDVAILFFVWSWSLTSRMPSSIRRITGIAVFMGLALTLILLFIAFETMPHPAEKNYFNRYYAYLGLNLGDFARTIFFSPWKIIENIGAMELLKYVNTILLPWLALPLAWVWWTLRDGRKNLRSNLTTALVLFSIIPSIASAALSTYTPLRRSGFHYVLELWPVMAALTILALARIESSGRWKGFAWLWAVFSMVALGQDPWGQLKEYGRDAYRASPARFAMQLIPADTGIAADEMSGPWLASRINTSRWPDVSIFKDGKPAWIVLNGMKEAPEGYDAAWAEGSWRGFELRKNQ